MDWKRVLRIAVCLVLVCTLVIGVSPIKAKAVYVLGFSETMAVGMLIVLFGMASGFIPPPTISMEQIEDVGEAFDYVIDDLVFEMQFPSGPSSPDDLDDDQKSDLQKAVDEARSDVKKLGGTVVEQVGSGMSGIEPSANLGMLLGAFIYDLIKEGVIDTQPDVDLSSGYVQMGPYRFDPYPASVSHLPYVLVAGNTQNGNTYDPGSFIVLFTSSPLIVEWKPEAFVDPVKGPEGYGCFWTSEGTSYKEWFYYPGTVNQGSNNSWYCMSFASPAFGSTYSTSSWVYRGYWQPLWANYDVYDYNDPTNLLIRGSDGPYVYGTDIIEPSAEIGAVVEGIKAGALLAADIPIPEVVDLSSIFEGVETGGLDAVLGNIQSAAAGLGSGSIALDDFRQSITYVSDGSDEDDPGEVEPGDDPTDPTEDPGPTEGVDDPDDPGGDSETIPADSTFADFPVLNFFAKLGELLQNISDGNLLGVKSFFNPWFESIGQWFQDIRGDISGVRDDLSGIDSSIQDIIDVNHQQNQINQVIQQEQNNIIEQGFASISAAVAGGISSAFVPRDGFFENKVNELTNEYAFAASIADTAKDMKTFLTNLGSVPPVIRINLGAATGKYHYGGDMVLVDFSFYEPYKPQMDAILSAFLWLWFCWRVVLTLPGIISGASGVIGAFAPTDIGSQGYVHLPSIPSGDIKRISSENNTVSGWGSPGSTSHYDAWRSKQNSYREALIKSKFRDGK